MTDPLDGVRTIVGPTILVRSGAYFDFLAPERSAFTLDDIAHGLSMVCRFAGQCAKFYSVAEHCVHVSRIVPAELALAGLMHDASEAFLGDVSRPLKTLLPQYKAIERRVEAAIFARFGLPFPIPDAVKAADMAMLIAEQHQAMQNHDAWSVEAAPADVKLEFLPPAEAKARFLLRFDWLTRGKVDG
ncbi:hypothetical protein DFR50_15921 [Roseiarcus fermentans]|uniref:Metal dependent phosphohydrolase n=1 Tax=Roseiarcus fermentans TaxID=1473586 RepID=A0A366EGD5_9HYPH|nr:metal-dependent phosphohydrolase [Roseiarcus fermentans]RBP01076.1 hypothetical protein DFR50_15921 [Roseiarcus fermentans]